MSRGDDPKTESPFRRPPIMGGYPISDPDEQAAIKRVLVGGEGVVSSGWVVKQQPEGSEVCGGCGGEVCHVTVGRPGGLWMTASMCPVCNTAVPLVLFRAKAS